MTKKKIVKIPIIGKPLEYTLKLAGFWPGQLNNIGRIVMISPLFTMIPFQCWDAIRLIDNPLLFVDNLSMVMSETLIYTKFIIIWLNKSYLLDILREMANDLSDKMVMDKWVTLNYNSRRFCKYDYGMYMGVCVLFYVQFILMYTQMPVENRETLIKAYYPFDYKTTPIFEILTFVQIIQGLMLTSTQVLCESLLVALILHVSGHIDLLIDQIQQFSKNCDTQKPSSSLAFVIERHLKVLHLVNKIDTVYTYVSFAQVFCSIFIICATGFVIITMAGSDQIIILMKFIMLYITLMLQAFTFCFSGQHLINKSETIPYQLYNSLWYNAKPSEIKSISFLIKRAQIPLYLSAGKFTSLSTQSFTLILKTSFSYLSVLRASYT